MHQQRASPNVYQNSLCKAQHCWLVLSISSKSGTKNDTHARNIEHHCGTSHTRRCKFSKILLVTNSASPSENDISYYRSSNLPCFLLRPSSVFQRLHHAGLKIFRFQSLTMTSQLGNDTVASGPRRKYDFQAFFWHFSHVYVKIRGNMDPAPSIWWNPGKVGLRLAKKIRVNLVSSG